MGCDKNRTLRPRGRFLFVSSAPSYHIETSLYCKKGNVNEKWVSFLDLQENESLKIKFISIVV